jgi:hypothetical protein
MTPSNTIDHVVANAGIAIEDEVFSYNGNPSHRFQNLEPHQPLTNTIRRTRIPIPAPKPQNSRRKPLRHPLHNQTRLSHLHQAKRLRRTFRISKRHHPHPHRLRSGFPRLSPRSAVPEHQMGDPRDNARPPPHDALSRQSSEYDFALVSISHPSICRHNRSTTYRKATPSPQIPSNSLHQQVRPHLDPAHRRFRPRRVRGRLLRNTRRWRQALAAPHGGLQYQRAANVPRSEEVGSERVLGFGLG